MIVQIPIRRADTMLTVDTTLITTDDYIRLLIRGLRSYLNSRIPKDIPKSAVMRVAKQNLKRIYVK